MTTLRSRAFSFLVAGALVHACTHGEPPARTALDEQSTRRVACILPLGDSITQGDAAHLSYRYFLFRDLTARGAQFRLVGSQHEHFGGSPLYPHPVFQRDHEGHWGWRVDEVRDHLTAWLAGYPLGIALVHLGTNDVIQHQAVDETVRELGQVIDLLRARNPTVAILLAQPIPSAYEWNAELLRLSDRLPALIAAKQRTESPLVLIDPRVGFDPALDTYDGVHPNELGEQKLAASFREALLPLLSQAAPCPAP